MTRTEVAQVLAILHGAYRTEVDEAMALVWANVLETVQLEDALEAAGVWVKSEPYFPTPAGLLAAIRTAKQERLHARAEEQAAVGAWRCDGSRWLEPPARAGDGRVRLEPCPTCNPWLREQWEAGNFAQVRLPKPPEDYVPPLACTPREALEAQRVGVPDHIRQQLADMKARTRMPKGRK